MEKRIIKLRNGGNLELDCTPEFYSVVRKSMNISSMRDITDDELRSFVHSTFREAIDKAERELVEKNDQ